MQSSTESKIAELPAVEIDTTAGTQTRYQHDVDSNNRSEKTVKQYTKDMLEGIYFDPIDVFAEKGSERFILADGFHRLPARIAAGFQTIECRVHEGGVRDARKFSIESNHAHGLPRTRHDKRNAVNMTLDDLEWGQLGNRAIARMCGVSHTLVAKVREDRTVGNREGKRRENKATSTQALNEVNGASGGVGGNVATHESIEPPRRLPRTQREVNRDDAFEGAKQWNQAWTENHGELAEFDNFEHVAVVRKLRIGADEYIARYMKAQQEKAA